MIRRFFQFILCFALCAVLFPINVNAAGGYCVIKGEKVYHSVFCSETWGYNLEDMKWYKTINEVERTGYKPCEHCAEGMFDFEEDGATYWFSKDDKIQNALEMERFMAIIDAMEILEEEQEKSYDSGYDAGFDVGYDDGYAEAIDELEEKYKKENKTSIILLIVISLFFGLPIISVIGEFFLSIVDAFKKKS